MALREAFPSKAPKGGAADGAFGNCAVIDVMMQFPLSLGTCGFRRRWTGVNVSCSRSLASNIGLGNLCHGRFADDVIADLLEDDLGTASFDGKAWSNPNYRGGHVAGHFIKWHTIKHQESSVAQDVKRIRENPLVPRDIPIHGFIYDVRTGHLNEVKEAERAGKAMRAA